MLGTRTLTEFSYISIKASRELAIRGIYPICSRPSYTNWLLTYLCMFSNSREYEIIYCQ